LALGASFLGLPDATFHTDTAAFHITLQWHVDDESLKFLMGDSLFYFWLLAFCWVGDKLTEQVLVIFTEPLYRADFFYESCNLVVSIQMYTRDANNLENKRHRCIYQSNEKVKV
jgi:hypothetical protein